MPIQVMFNESKIHLSSRRSGKEWSNESIRHWINEWNQSHHIRQINQAVNQSKNHAINHSLNDISDIESINQRSKQVDEKNITLADPNSNTYYSAGPLKHHATFLRHIHDRVIQRTCFFGPPCVSGSPGVLWFLWVQGQVVPETRFGGTGLTPKAFLGRSLMAVDVQQEGQARCSSPLGWDQGVGPPSWLRRPRPPKSRKFGGGYFALKFARKVGVWCIPLIRALGTTTGRQGPGARTARL